MTADAPCDHGQSTITRDTPVVHNIDITSHLLSRGNVSNEVPLGYRGLHQFYQFLVLRHSHRILMNVHRYAKHTSLLVILMVLCSMTVHRYQRADALIPYVVFKHISRNTANQLSLHAAEYEFSASSSSPLKKASNNPVRDRRIAKRWNGNYKHRSKKLCDAPKAKKLQLELSVKYSNGTISTKTLQKKRQETLQHVLTKAMLWNLFCDDYPDNMEIEQDIGDPDYLPDVACVDPNNGRPVFWGESGRMKVHKAVDLMQRYPEMHIVHGRWDMTLEEISKPLEENLQDLFDKDELGTLSQRPGRFSFCSLPLDVWRFINEDTGRIRLSRTDLEWKELVFPTTKKQ